MATSWYGPRPGKVLTASAQLGSKKQTGLAQKACRVRLIGDIFPYRERKSTPNQIAMSKPQDFLPLSTPVLHILLALGSTRLHGLGIMEAIAEKSEGKAVILPGTLYVTLNRMVDDGLIAEAERPEGADTRRKYYAVSPLGRSVVAAEMERMALLMDVARGDLLADG